MFSYQFAAQTHIGGRRENQDSYGSGMTPYGFVVTVCDGMGGAAGGKRAAETAVSLIIRDLRTSHHATPEPALIAAIEAANQAIFQISRLKTHLHGMGTTVTVLLVNKEAVYIAHVGDSRVYHLRNQQVLFRTFDHSAVFERVLMGQMTEEEARLSPESNIILRAVGVDASVDIDLHQSVWLPGDRFVLCTDGVSGIMPEPELLRQISQPKIPARIADELTEHVNHIGFAQGGRHDNLTIAVVDMG
nr:protein phosphatase 2C domain-containing protein [uncultured Arsenicibacter sp.]